VHGPTTPRLLLASSTSGAETTTNSVSREGFSTCIQADDPMISHGASQLLLAQSQSKRQRRTGELMPEHLALPFLFLRSAIDELVDRDR